MATDGFTSGGSAQAPTPFYTRLQEWILQQQDYEAKHSQPAPLTAAQRKLLSELEVAVTPAPTEPQIGDTNWVGILLEYRAAHQIYPGDGGVEFSEEAVAVPGPSSSPMRWRFQVRIEERMAAPFPSADGDSAEPPSFARKKDAKQFAARCAVEWLRANGHMPADGVRFPKGGVAAAVPPPPQQQQQATTRRASPSTSTLNNPGPGPNNGSSSSTSSKRSPRSSLSMATEVSSPSSSRYSPFDADERRATQEVNELCQSLNCQPPQYKLTEDPEHKGFWNGHAEFDPHGPLPAQLLTQLLAVGRTEGACGKKLARQQIAELLLPHLRLAWNARRAETRSFMSGPGGK
ncbi:hypothetical protein DL764_010986 [Monosporascus ibericus]|uniref:DRBM domain-containing protein n=1 Tax=Monosporascus ibericus TaxID=155417 RepID=A0A4Q4SU49_9PEZI|nr:hypothetical protein DL764_010986 [Monosporascus ibericus]